MTAKKADKFKGRIMKNLKRHRLKFDESGQTFTEYAMIMLLVVLVCILVFTTFGINLSAFFTNFIAAAFGA